MKEEIKEVIFDGKKIPGYYVSNLGNIYTTIKFKRNSFGQYEGIYFSENKVLMKPYLNYTSKGSTHASHRLVMEAFRPMMEYPPNRLKPFWDQTPYEVKLWICESVVIDHIDHDPTNNRLDNLQYVTPRENSRNAVKFYGGNVANKGKLKNIKNEKQESKITILDFV